MTTRMTVDEFFDAMHLQGIPGLIDTPQNRATVEVVVRLSCKGFPIQDRWPLYELEYAYECCHIPQNFNKQRGGRYERVSGVFLRGFDRTYDLDEWFGDTKAYSRMNDNVAVRRRMMKLLPPAPGWDSSQLWRVYKRATSLTIENLKNSFVDIFFAPGNDRKDRDVNLSSQRAEGSLSEYTFAQADPANLGFSIVACRNCSQKLRVPSSKNLYVTCRRCGHTFLVGS